MLQMFVDGKTPKEIALDLKLGISTVRNHLLNARCKFGVSTNAELIARAVAHGDVAVFMGEAQIEIPLQIVQ